MPNGRSGGFRLGRHEFKQILRDVVGETVVGKTLKEPVTCSRMMKMLQEWKRFRSSRQSHAIAGGRSSQRTWLGGAADGWFQSSGECIRRAANGCAEVRSSFRTLRSRAPFSARNDASGFVLISRISYCRDGLSTIRRSLPSHWIVAIGAFREKPGTSNFSSRTSPRANVSRPAAPASSS